MRSSCASAAVDLPAVQRGDQPEVVVGAQRRDPRDEQHLGEEQPAVAGARERIEAADLEPRQHAAGDPDEHDGDGGEGREATDDPDGVGAVGLARAGRAGAATAGRARRSTRR